MWEKNTAPTGYLMLDGGTYLISEYTELNDHYNGAYNTGSEAVGEFSVPDRRGYAPRGYKEGGIIDGQGDVLGENRGSDTVGLTANNLPYHKHDINNLTTSIDGEHTHSATIQKGDGATNRNFMRQAGGADGTNTDDIVTLSDAGNHSHRVSGTTEFNTTTQQAVEITNPVFLVNFIVKALP
jgi:microcystin-dependent protein